MTDGRPPLYCCQNSSTISHPLVILPTHNEEHNIRHVLGTIREHYSGDICIVDDGSKDNTPQILSQLEEPSIDVISHRTNKGYGAALISGFKHALTHHYDSVITIDSDGQHDPKLLPAFLEALKDADIVSGTRYGSTTVAGDQAPPDRKRINMQVTEMLRNTLSLNITDSFCGYKAYRIRAIKKLSLNETGYGFPLEVWVDAAAHDLRITELPVPRVYLDLNRSFGGDLDDPEKRLCYYCQVIESSFLKNFGYPLKQGISKNSICCGNA